MDKKVFQQRLREALATINEKATVNPGYMEDLKVSSPSVAEALADLDPSLKDIGR